MSLWNCYRWTKAQEQKFWNWGKLGIRIWQKLIEQKLIDAEVDKVDVSSILKNNKQLMI